MKLLSKAALLTHLTDLHERVVTDPLLLGDGGVLIRELTAEQRIHAQQAATEDADPEGRPNEALYRALLVAYCVVDPDSGRPYADGRTNADGTPRIDPRTRAPLFSADEVVDLMAGRTLLVDLLVSEITKLSAVGPTALFRGDPRAERVERDARPGAGGGGENPERPPDQGAGDDDRGAVQPSGAGDGGGAEPVGLPEPAVVA